MRAKFYGMTAFALVLLLAGSLYCGSISAEKNFFDLSNLSESGDGFYTMKDRQDGSVILRTARILHPGDEYIDEANRYFRVVMLEENTAWVEQIEEKGAAAGDAGAAVQPSAGEMAAGQSAQSTQASEKKPAIGIYHTHGAESYVPSDGTDTIDQGGGILQVGDVLANALEKKGYTVDHIREPHTPHDAGAYQRSRRTAEELVTEGDKLIFDVHRDAVPAEEYERTVDGEEVTRILLVVGQQNQNSDNNRNFALNLKEIADKEHPGLIKGILGAQGNYNQDLTPRAMLIEVGSHENSREDAERAVALFADVVDVYAAGSGASPGGGKAAMQSDRFSLGSILKVVLVAAGALLAYLLIAAGSLEEFRNKLSNFFKREFADVLNFGRRGGGDRGRDD